MYYKLHTTCLKLHTASHCHRTVYSILQCTLPNFALTLAPNCALRKKIPNKDPTELIIHICFLDSLERIERLGRQPHWQINPTQSILANPSYGRSYPESRDNVQITHIQRMACLLSHDLSLRADLSLILLNAPSISIGVTILPYTINVVSLNR